MDKAAALRVLANLEALKAKGYRPLKKGEFNMALIAKARMKSRMKGNGK